MIKQLRRRHLQIWSLLSLLIPLGIVMAWLVIPSQPPVKLLPSDTTGALPELVRSVDSPDYRVTLRSNRAGTRWQLEWENKTVLMVPSAVIYRVTDPAADPDKNELIGRIEARGKYLFPLKEDGAGYKTLRLTLYDFIHHKIVDRINF